VATGLKEFLAVLPALDAEKTAQEKAEDQEYAAEVARAANKEFIVCNEHQLRTGTGVDCSLFIPKYVPKPLGLAETREVKNKLDPLSNQVIPRSVIVNTTTGTERYELPRVIVEGQIVNNVWHTVADLGSVGDPALNWYFRKLGAKGTQLWERPHRTICDWLGGLTLAGFTPGRYEWYAVLGLRKAPFGNKQITEW
jgi:hypothetical protein